ncbi:TM2 domain-containing protein [Nocardioides sp. cx-169]|uniref:TM2 domain-containing protein n=1 Tax=Nocardioides sp. cx-169 TaxID=2899080 RepID=UPI001E2E4496|nr:TM2 domain-containing protein [Nocardioides sp. cx-169]MCD4534507.1 TM2 domain-containing protein [Nocardioides sp. cx-169]
MTQGRENPYDPYDPERPQSGDPQGTPPPPPYGQPQQPPYGQQPPYPGYPMAPMGVPGAPYGVHPGTGIPYSDKQKLVAGLLQILVPFGVGRFYIGDTGVGIAQLVVSIITCGVGCLWPVIDGILMLVQDSKDANGLMLR